DFMASHRAKHSLSNNLRKHGRHGLPYHLAHLFDMIGCELETRRKCLNRCSLTDRYRRPLWIWMPKAALTRGCPTRGHGYRNLLPRHATIDIRKSVVRTTMTSGAQIFWDAQPSLARIGRRQALKSHWLQVSYNVPVMLSWATAGVRSSQRYRLLHG